MTPQGSQKPILLAVQFRTLMYKNGHGKIIGSFNDGFHFLDLELGSTPFILLLFGGRYALVRNPLTQGQ